MPTTLDTTPHSMHDSMLYDQLTERGIQHIEELASAIWNEYNATDPGITIMEVLAYVIADLSYRTSFEMKDIMQGYQGTKSTDRDLYLADQILPNHPWTAKDLRNILLDKPRLNPQPGTSKLELRNVWPTVSKTSEEQLWFDNNQKILVYESKLLDSLPKGVDKPEELGHKKITLNGLYNIQLEFEPDPTEKRPWLQTPNFNDFEQCFQYSGNTYCVSILMPYWEDVPFDFRSIDPASSALKIRNGRNHFIAIDKLNYDEHFYDYFAELNLFDGIGNTIPVDFNIRLNDYLKTDIDINGKKYKVQVQFIDWHEVANRVDWDYGQVISTNVPTLLGTTQYPIEVSPSHSELIFDVTIQYKLPMTPSGKEERMQARITFLDPNDVYPLRQQMTAVKAAIIDNFSAAGGQVLGRYVLEYIGLERELERTVLDTNSGYLANYLDKLQWLWDHVYGSLGKEHVNLNQYTAGLRNICEDFFSFSMARLQEIAVFGNVVIAPEFNPNKVLGEIYFVIDQFLSPIVQFRTLNELKDAGHSLADAFNGPILQHGFLTDDDTSVLDRRDTIYTSDLVNIIMDIPGVIAIEGLNLSNYIDNRLMGRNVLNCLSLTNSELYHPKLSIPKSGLTVTVEDESYPLNDKVINDWFDSHITEKLNNQVPDEAYDELSLPKGNDMQIESYHSLQHDLPEIYGVGQYGLPLDATDERKGQAKQLKGYLLFFDQLMANYLSQVANLRELFSLDRKIDATYKNQALYDVPHVQPLLKDFQESGETWEDFTDDVDNIYRTTLNETSEDSVTFNDRRNRFLDHMIGRFSESFSMYATAQYQRYRYLLDVQGGTPDDIKAAMDQYQQKRQEVAGNLIADKICFLEDYPVISSERARAYNYLTGASWGTNSDNVSGYKKRLCRKLGIKNWSHDHIFQNGDEGMHIVEHILLRPRTEQEQLLALNSTTFYNSEIDPYSFKLTIALPMQNDRFDSPDYRRFVERMIRTETPAHIALDIRWMEDCGIEFEHAYEEWLFSLSRLAAEGPAVPKSRTYEQYLSSHNQFIEYMNGDCGQEVEVVLNAFDKDDIMFIPDSSDHISYLYGATDIYAFEFLPPGSNSNIYKLDGTGNANHIETLPNVPAWYIIPNGQGFAEKYGGPGQYRVDYYYHNTNKRLYIDVIGDAKPVDIELWYVKHPIDPDGDCYTVDMSLLDAYFMKFIEPGGTARIYMVAADGTRTQVDTVLNADTYHIYNFISPNGAGRYEIDYTKDGVTTSICINIGTIKIRVFDVLGGGEQFLNSSKEVNITGVKAELKTIFEPAGGLAKRYRVDNNGGLIFETDLLGNADMVTFNATGSYHYTYEHLGQSDFVTINFTKEDTNVKVEIWEGDLFFPPNQGDLYVFDPFYDLNYYLHFEPGNGLAEVYIVRDGQELQWGGAQIPDPPQNEHLFGELWDSAGPGEFIVRYIVGANQAEVRFTLVDPMVRFFAAGLVEQTRNDANELFFVNDDPSAYNVLLGPEDGVLEIRGETGPWAGQQRYFADPAKQFVFKPSEWQPGYYKLTYSYPNFNMNDELFFMIEGQELPDDGNNDLPLPVVDDPPVNEEEEPTPIDDEPIPSPPPPQPVDEEAIDGEPIKAVEATNLEAVSLSEQPIKSVEPIESEIVSLSEQPIKSPPRPTNEDGLVNVEPIEPMEPIAVKEISPKSAVHFSISKVTDLGEGKYRIEPIPNAAADKYRWEVDGRYRSVSKTPKLTINLLDVEQQTLSLETTTGEKTQYSEMVFNAEVIQSYL